MARILVIEDDKKLNDGICLVLKGEENEMLQSYSFTQSMAIMKENDFDLVILDLNLPDGNGLDFLTPLRRTSMLPVIILTANNLEMDVVTGLKLGADDYITKPFSLMELRARVEVQLRKSAGNKSDRINMGDFDFDFKKMKYLVKGKEIELSKTEQCLLRVLLDYKGITVTRNTLIDRVWNGDMEFVDEHALTVAVKRLRDKLGENPAEPEHIKTIYGIGYTWVVR